MAHGSRRDSANSEFLELVERIDPKAQYSLTQGAFLEQTTPTLMQSCKVAIDAGHTSIDVYPLFFNCGKHVEKDIPQQVSEVIERFSECTIRLLPYFGSSEGLAGLVVEHLAQHKE